MITSESDGVQAPTETQQYEQFLAEIQAAFDQATAGRGDLFTTDAAELFAVFLAALPETRRQHYTCHACRDFVSKFGGLVVIDENGSQRPALWPAHTPEFFQPAVTAVCDRLTAAAVTGVFLSAEAVWGRPVTGEWQHMAVRPRQRFVSTVHSAEQVMAAKRAEHQMLLAALAQYPAATVQTALTILEADALYRSEKVLGVARWLADLQQRLAATKHARRQANIIWRAVAGAPAGFCHVKSTMIGTLLDDLALGLDFATVSRRFAEKMHPLQYQRPQAAPRAGNIAQAERIVAQLAAAGALRRRFARLEELQLLWQPRPADKPTTPSTPGVFAHLTPRAAPSERTATHLAVPESNITWLKFAREVLPTAEHIDVVVPERGNFAALVTAVDPTAPPILQWDTAEARNPVSWYVYSHASPAERWGLVPGTHCALTGISLQPSMWHGEDRWPQFGRSVFFILQGAKDSVHCSAAIFPEILKADYHDIRATIEAYSRSTQLEGQEAASACGLRLDHDAGGLSVRVTRERVVFQYRIERWD